MEWEWHLNIRGNGTKRTLGFGNTEQAKNVDQNSFNVNFSKQNSQ